MSSGPAEIQFLPPVDQAVTVEPAVELDDLDQDEPEERPARGYNQMPSSREFFYTSRGRTLKFPVGQYGTSHTLHITAPVVMEQQTENGKPLYWDEEATRPRMQAIVSGYVTEGLSGSGDDGFRSVYVRGGIQKAIGAACRRAGVVEPGPGMILTLDYTHDGAQPTDPRKRPPKEYFATLELVEQWESDPRFQGHKGTRHRADQP